MPPDADMLMNALAVDQAGLDEHVSVPLGPVMQTVALVAWARPEHFVATRVADTAVLLPPGSCSARGADSWNVQPSSSAAAEGAPLVRAPTDPAAMATANANRMDLEKRWRVSVC